MRTRRRLRGATTPVLGPALVPATTEVLVLTAGTALLAVAALGITLAA